VTISILSAGPDNVAVNTSVTYDGIKVTVAGTAALAMGSFPKSVLAHPGPV
jgi:hypothetical protein